MPSPTLRCIGVSREMVSTTLAGLSPVPRRLRPQSHVGARGRPPSSRSSLLDFLLHRTKPRISTTHGVSSSPLVNSASPCRERTVRLTAKQSITGAARPSAVYNFLVRQTEVHPSGSLKASRTTVTEVMALLKRSMSALPFSPDLRECGQAVRRAEDVAPSAFLVARRTMPIRTIRLFPYGASLFHVRPGALSGKGHAGSVPLCLQLNGSVGVAALLADHLPLTVVLGRGLPTPCGILLPPAMERTGIGVMAANEMCIVSGVIRWRQPPLWIYTSRIHQTR
jgi:hypothetical protein